jgi:ketosteroid isomerase-like protein
MKNKLTISFIPLILFLTTAIASAQINVSLKEEFDALHERMNSWYLDRNVDSLVSLYVDEPAFLPEYKSPIFSKEGVNTFYKNWFGDSPVLGVEKELYALEVYGDHVLELGNVKITHNDRMDSLRVYDAHYMILWQLTNGGLKILSEAIGSQSYLEVHDVPWAHVQDHSNPRIATEDVSAKIMNEVSAVHAVVIKAVAEGDGETRANGFTMDAILLPNFETIYRGMDAIRPRMLKTYHPGVSFKVKHTFNRLWDLGDHVFVVGQYAGGWGDKKNGGYFRGNMSSLLKRTEDGLRTHRELTNRDSALILYGQ